VEWLKKGGKRMHLSDERKLVALMKENSPHAYLATCDGDQPRVRPVSPIVEDDMSIWVTTYSTSRKVKRIRENPRICLHLWSSLTAIRPPLSSVKLTIIPDLEEKRRGEESVEAGHLRFVGAFPEWAGL
jgi:hypothetical protein